MLIIENGESNLELIAKLVRRAGLTPVGATSLTEGKARFKQNMPETFLCAIVAYSLPDAQQGQAIDFAINAFIPTIATTESLDNDIRDKVLERDVVDYVPKENSQNYDYLSRLIGRLEKINLPVLSSLALIAYCEHEPYHYFSAITSLHLSA
ncbi:hypothetical protein KUL42_21400 [Alteromonas sp. KUL42]|nr:hypothetical protein KUL42_21400 [Alteromonas sp. KUL42]